MPAGAEGAHKVVQEGKCLECHDAHASNNPRQLVDDVGELCYRCHKEVKTGQNNAKLTHKPVEEGRCTACHLPHGSKIKGGLPRPLKGLWVSCHKDFEKSIKEDNAFAHQPVTEGAFDQ